MSNGTDVAVVQPKTLKEYIEVKRPEIASMLPSHVNVERFLKSAMLAVARDRNLQECTPLSLFTAVVNAAELGLDFTPARGHAYLVKYGTSAQMMPGFRGMIDLAKRTGDVSQIEAHIVHDADRFEMEFGTTPKLVHVPEIRKPTGKPIGVYAVAHFNDGTSQFEFMSIEQVDAIRKRSKAANNGPWVTDYMEMARKTVVRRLFKYLPSSSDLLDKAIEADNKAVGMVDFEIEPMEDGEKTSKLADKLAAKVATPVAEEPPAETINESTGEVEGPAPAKRGRKPKEEALPVADYKGRLKAAMAIFSEREVIEAKEKLGIRKLYDTDLTQDEAKSILQILNKDGE